MFAQSHPPKSPMSSHETTLQQPPTCSPCKKSTMKLRPDSLLLNDLVSDSFNGRAAQLVSVPHKLALKEPLEKNAEKLLKVPLLSLNCSFGMVTEDVEGLIPLKKVVARHRGKHKSNVVVMFAIRRPGCGSCREHAEQLSQLAAQENFSLVGIVKDRGVDDEDLLEFRDKYFKFPIYQDQKWNLYKALGNRKVSARQLITGFIRSHKRYSEKNIHTTLGKSDGWTKGGVLIFDRKVKLRYAYEEEYGEELDLRAIRTAIHAARTRRRKVDDIDFSEVDLSWSEGGIEDENDTDSFSGSFASIDYP